MNIHDIDFTDLKIQEFLASQESTKVKSGEHFWDALAEFLENGYEDTGITLPWAKTHEKIRLRGGEVSIWAGINGHMKSTVVGQVALWAARDVKVGMMSFEMPVPLSMLRMAKQASGSENPAIRFGHDLSMWMRNRLYFYDRLDSVPPERVLGCAFHMAKELGIKLIVIDCLIMVRGITQDLERESRFMATLTALAKSMNIHIALVHHVRKPAKGGDEYIPSRFDVRGAGELVDMCSTLIICWNDKSKQNLLNRRELGMALTPDEEDKLNNDPDQKLIVAKQRNGEYEGIVALYLNRPAMQFTPISDRTPMPFDIPRLELLQGGG